VDLAVHPRYGEELTIVSAHGRNGVWAETSDGQLRVLPIAWTTLQPRASALVLGERQVRLAPDALRQLAHWVATRACGLGVDGEVGQFDKYMMNPAPDGCGSEGRTIEGIERRREDVAVGDGERCSSGSAAVVGEAGSPSVHQRARRSWRDRR
jgi:hypothetical protein